MSIARFLLISLALGLLSISTATSTLAETGARLVFEGRVEAQVETKIDSSTTGATRLTWSTNSASPVTIEARSLGATNSRRPASQATPHKVIFRKVVNSSSKAIFELSNSKINDSHLSGLTIIITAQ